MIVFLQKLLPIRTKLLETIYTVGVLYEQFSLKSLRERCVELPDYTNLPESTGYHWNPLRISN